MQSLLRLTVYLKRYRYSFGLAVLGNLIGGSLFVAVLNYGHIRKSQTVSEEG